VEAKLKAEALVAASRKGLADCGGELEPESRARIETALHPVESLLTSENPQTQTGDIRALQTACAALDEATRPLADLLMDKAMESMLRKRGILK
jgi:hypothetical protein